MKTQTEALQSEIEQLRAELKQLHQDRGASKSVIESLIELADDAGHKNDRRVTSAQQFVQAGMTTK